MSLLPFTVYLKNYKWELSSAILLTTLDLREINEDSIVVYRNCIS
jgi:hypothetical protein